MSVNFTKNVAPATQPDASQQSVRVNMALPAPLAHQLAERSAKTGLSVPMILRFAAIEYLKK